MGVSDTPTRIPKGPSLAKSNIPVPLGAKSKENTQAETSRAVTPTGIPRSPIYKNTSKSKPDANRSKSTTNTILQGRSITKPLSRSRSKGPNKANTENQLEKQETAIEVLQPVRKLTLSKTKNSFRQEDSVVSVVEMSYRPNLQNSTYDDSHHVPTNRSQIPPDNRDPTYVKIHEPSGYRKGGDYASSSGGYDRDYSNHSPGKKSYSYDDGPVEDVSSLFPRPNTVPLKPQSYMEYKGQNNSQTYGSDEPRRFLQTQRQNFNHQRVPDRPTFINPPIPGLKYTTNEDLDLLLSKYKSKPPVQSGHEYTVYNATVTLDSERDPDFSHAPLPVVKYGKEHSHEANNYSNMNETHNVNHGIQNDKHTPKTYCGESGEAKIHPPDPDQMGNKILIKSKVVPDKTCHEFPFRETAFGDLVVQADQIVFESKSLSVLVADLAKVTILKKDLKQSISVYDKEIIAAQIEDVIHKCLSPYHHDKNKNCGGNPALPYKVGGGAHNPNDSAEDDMEGKELVHIRYSSNTSMGTEKLMTEMHQRIKLGRNADTHVVIGNKVFPCHALVLEVYSTYFDNLISTRSRNSVRRVILPEAEVSDEIFPVIMDWIMQNESGRVTVINKTNVVSLFSAAKYLDIGELKSQCVKFLKEKVETNDRYLMNLWEDVKQRPNCQELMSVISAKAAASFQHIYQERQFHKLDVDELVMLLSSDDIVIDSELEVYDTAVRWLLKDWDTRKISTNQVMSAVRFGLLSPLELTQIAHSPEMSKNEELRDYGEVLSYGNVKALIDDGLAFSIINLSYANQPEKLQNWIESTGIKQPRPRTHLIHHHHHHHHHHPKSHSDSVQGHLVDNDPRIRNSPSYTIVKDISETHNLDIMDEAVRETNSHHDELHTSNDLDPSQSRNVASLSGIDHINSSLPNQDIMRRRSKTPSSMSSTPLHLQHVLDKAGQPFKQEDIQSLGQRSSKGSSNSSRSRSKSSGKYQYDHKENRHR